MNLQNKRVMITGGSSGIGLTLAKAFFGQGAKVMICGRSQKALDAAKVECPYLEIYLCDLGKLEELELLIESIGDRIDIWINNAGIFQEYFFLNPNAGFKELENELVINFSAAALAITKLIPYLRKRSESAIVNITAGMVYVPLVKNPMYNASKAALHSFIISAREQVKSTSIQIIEVAPPMVDTKLTKSMEGKRVSTEVIAKEVLKSLKENRPNILIGQVKTLVLMNRFFPKLMLRLLNPE